MKKLIYLLVILSIILGCEKNKNGTIRYNISYTNSVIKSLRSNNDLNLKNIIGDSDSLYTQFGDYITSLSPSIFTAKFKTIRFNDELVCTNGGHLLELVNHDAPQNHPSRFADFTNNSTVSVIPTLYGTDIDQDGGSFTANEINFIYFYFTISYFYQEVALPAQYNSIDLTQFKQQYFNLEYFENENTYLSNNVYKGTQYPLIDAMFTQCNGCPNTFVFGNTDSTYISYTEGNNPLWGMGGIVIRSNAYTAFTLFRPKQGETLNLNTILSFNSTNLIQIYAGNDNIPYTSDDVFVYAPNFWERLSVRVVID